MMARKRLGLLAATALVGACNKGGVICTSGLNPCDNACFDLASDSSNCGACNRQCGGSQICQSGACQCQQGAVLCGGICIDVASDPHNCGACGQLDGGNVCTADEVCEQSQCTTRCTRAEFTICGRSCVDLGSDVNHCGTCGHACRNAGSCHRGFCSYDVVAACFNTGQVVGIQATSGAVGPRQSIRAAPQALGSFEDVLIVADAYDQVLSQARLEDLSPLNGTTRVGSSPNHIVAEGSYVYVVNSLGDTLQILKQTATPADLDAGSITLPDGGIRRAFLDGGLFPSGLQLATVGQVNVGRGTSPQALVKVGTQVYIPIYEGAGTVFQVDVSWPADAGIARSFDLSGIDLRPFDGGTTYPRPSAIAAARGRLYVPLGNLRITPEGFYVPGGPALLARIDLDGGQVSGVELGDSCLDAFWISAADDGLYVSCSGAVTYGPGYVPIAVEKSGVVFLDAQDRVVSTWNVSCAPGATGCLPPVVTRFARIGDQLYLADESAGRIFVVERVNNQLIERRGLNAQDGGPPIDACSRDGGISLVIDVIGIP